MSWLVEERWVGKPPGGWRPLILSTEHASRTDALAEFEAISRLMSQWGVYGPTASRRLVLVQSGPPWLDPDPRPLPGGPRGAR